MRFDTFNFTLVGLAALLCAVAIFRSQHFGAPIPPKRKHPIGF